MDEFSDKDTSKHSLTPLFMQNFTLENCKTIEAKTNMLKFALAAEILQNV